MSMNMVILKGRLVRDPEMRTTQNGISNARFTLAVDRQTANANGVRESDFITCVAWRQTADFVGKYFTKGQEMLVKDGSLQVRSYDAQDGTKRTVAEVIVNRVDFCGRKGESGSAPMAAEQPVFEEITDDEGLPF